MKTWLITDQAVPKSEPLTPFILAAAPTQIHDVAAGLAKRLAIDDVIIVDIFLTFKDSEYQQYQDLGGIALLKFLRIQGVHHHIVLLSPWGLAELLRMDASHSILASRGVTVADYTLELAFNWSQLSTDKAPSANALRPYFKASISLPRDERHTWANWWGADRIRGMWNRSTEPEKKIPPIPDLVKELKVLRNAELTYVYGHDNDNTEQVDTGELPLALANQTVLFVDDNHALGWSSILRSLLFHDSRSMRLTPESPKSGEDLERFKARLFQKIISQQKYPTLIILDLRLFAEAHSVADQDLSGMQLLRAMRARFPTIPVVMLTATARGSTHTLLKDYGAFGVWTKPSIEDAGKAGYERRALLDLLEVLKEACIHSSDPIVRNHATADILINRMERWDWTAPPKGHQRVMKATLRKIQFIQHDECLVDSNFLLSKESHRVLPLLYFMARERKVHSRSPLIIIDEVFDELFKWSKRSLKGLDADSQRAARTARMVLPRILGWLECGLVSNAVAIAGTYDPKAYADRAFAREIPRFLGSRPAARLVLFSDDQECQAVIRRRIMEAGIDATRFKSVATWDLTGVLAELK